MRRTSPEPKRRDHLAADLVVEVARSLAFTSRPGDHHQRQEVLLARMTLARRGRLVPLGEPRLALGSRRFRGLVEPGVEGGRGPRIAVAEMTQVMEAHAAADDCDALIAQRRERL